MARGTAPATTKGKTMSTDYSYRNRQRADIANTIMAQIGRPALWGLGAHDFTVPAEDGLAFTARILPFKADGTRSDSPRNMQVKIILNSMDYYEVTVTHRRGSKVTTHYESPGNPGMDFSQLRALMYALDWDGPEAVNWERYFAAQ